jgi:peptidoglycan hydrolase-like protein with peptidoglycan-binding domain
MSLIDLATQRQLQLYQSGQQVEYVRRGSSDEAALRALLGAAGYPVTDGAGDLEKQVRAYQRAQGLQVDGKAGPQTLGSLRTFVNERLSASETPTSLSDAQANTFLSRDSITRAPTAGQLAAPPPAGQTRVGGADDEATRRRLEEALRRNQETRPADQPSIELTADNKLVVRGSSANEDIRVERRGDQIHASIRDIRDPSRVLERSFAAKDVKSADIDGGDGNDLIHNGTRQTRGVDNATIRLSGSAGNDVNAVFSNGNNVTVEGGNSSSTNVVMYGDESKVVSSRGRDAIAVVGNDAQIRGDRDDVVVMTGRNNQAGTDSGEGFRGHVASSPMGYILQHEGANLIGLDEDGKAKTSDEVVRRAELHATEMEKRSAEIRGTGGRRG